MAPNGPKEQERNKKMKKIVLTGLLLIVMIFTLTGCTNDKKSTNSTNKTSSSSKKTNTTSSNTTNTTNQESEVNNVDFEANAKKQMAMPEEGETVAIMHVKNFGDIKFKFFENVAPKAVENFLTHAKNGYYNGVTFHRVIDEFMIQGGDPEGTGMGGESIWGKGFVIILVRQINNHSCLPTTQSNIRSSASRLCGGRIGNHVKIMDGYRHCAVSGPRAGRPDHWAHRPRRPAEDRSKDTSQETCWN